METKNISKTRHQKCTDLNRLALDYGDFLFKFAASRVNNPEVIKDLIQDTYLAALKSIHSFKGLSSEKTWLTSILKHKIFDHYHQKQYTNKYRVDLDESFENCPHAEECSYVNNPDWGETPESLYCKKSVDEAVNSCIKNMSENSQKVFKLSEIYGLSTTDICSELDITPTNLRVTLFRTRNKLKKCLIGDSLLN